MNNKIIEFLSERANCDYQIGIFNGKKETYDELLKKFPTKHNGHSYLDGCYCHSYEAFYPNEVRVTIYVNYSDNEFKERAREIALIKAQGKAQGACMQKLRETQEAKKE